MKRVVAVVASLAVVAPSVRASAEGAGVASSKEALEGCTATPIGDEGWEYECADVSANIVDDARQIDPATYLDGVRVGAEARARAGRQEFTRERARLGGRDAEVLRAERGGAVDVTALLARAEGTRIVGCAAVAAGRCGPVLDALAASAWRGGAAKGSVALQAPELRIGDRRPTVPAGCSPRPTSAGGQIVCPGGFTAMWASVPDDETLSRAVRGFGEKLSAMIDMWPGQRPEPKDLPCRIAGAAATCRSLIATAGARRFVALWGGVTLGSVRTVAACTSDGQEAIPPPCSALFEAR